MSSQTVEVIHHVFIDSNDPTARNQVIDGTQLTITLPFPPHVDPHDLVVKSRDGKVPARSPNAFIIYRNVYFETAKNAGYLLPMTVISSMASQSWKRESEVVKSEYKRLAKEAYDVRNEMLPKKDRKRKREKWNIVSFGKSNEFHKSPALKTQKYTKVTNPTSEVTQLPSLIPPPNSINLQPTNNNGITPVTPSFEQFNFNFIQNIIPSPEMPEMYSSPGSSIISSPEINEYSPPESSSLGNNSIETQILSEEELFNLINPVNNGILTGTEQIFINYNEIENFGESAFFYIEPSSRADFDFSYHF